MNFEPWLYVVAAGAVLAALFLLYAMKARGGKKKEPLDVLEVTEGWPPTVERSVTVDDARKAQEELRTLDLEREVLSYTIRRLYEAQAEGKISEEERERLARRYKERMMRIKDAISRSESVVALHELETMQDDLVKLFSARFDEMNEKIEDLRTRLEVKPVIEAPIPSPAPPSARPERGRRERKRPPSPKKTEAEKRIEEIRAEVEKVLERLGQIEVEA